MTEKNWFEDIKKYVTGGLWSEAMVRNAVAKGKITVAEAETILAGVK